MLSHKACRVALPGSKLFARTIANLTHNEFPPKMDDTVREVKAVIEEQTKRESINFASNDYLGLNKNQEVIKAAQYALETHGPDLGYIKSLTGTQNVHQTLEQQLAAFHHQDDCVLYPSGHNPHIGLFEAIVGMNDAIICDECNNSSIIDATCFSKAKVYMYNHMDIQDLQKTLETAKNEGANVRLVITQGAFRETNEVVPLKEIGQVCHEADAMLAVDASHGVGVLGEYAKGTPEFYKVQEKVHIINSTFSSTLGDGSGSYTAGMKEIIDIIRQKARPYLFSNTLCPPVVQAASEALELIENSKTDIQKLFENAKIFRNKMREAGFDVHGENLPNCPVYIGDHTLAKEVADELQNNGIIVQTLGAPYVPNEDAFIRVNMNAGHTPNDIERCVAMFTEVAKTRNLLAQKKLATM